MTHTLHNHYSCWHPGRSNSMESVSEICAWHKSTRQPQKGFELRFPPPRSLKMDPRRRVAVIGSGISGLSAAWLLNRSGIHVTLYEKEDDCGGHTLTDYNCPVPLDLGFQVYNLTTYPNLVGFLECLGVDSEPSQMSFSCSVDNGRFEWGSEGLDAVFAQRKNLVSLPFLWMLYEVTRFGRCAPKVLEPDNESKLRNMTLGEYIESEKYSHLFRTCYLLPMCASVWSISFETVLQFPIVVLVRFWVNHHLLDIFQRPRWRVVKGRSQSYVKRVLECVPDVRTSHKVTSVTTGQNGKVQVTCDGGIEEFDDVIIATHSDTALSILGESATSEETEILSSIPYESSTVYVHSDESLMPKLKSTWSCWNFIGRNQPGAVSDPVCVTYWGNRLQNFAATDPDLFVTLNPSNPPEASKTIRKLQLEHPILNLAGMDAQNRLDTIQGNRGIHFAGAWCGYGFHEDGIKAGTKVAQLLGAEVPWTPRSVSPKMSLMDKFFLNLFDRFAKIAIQHGDLRLILPNGEELSYGNGEVSNTVEEWHGAPPLKATLRLFNMNMFRKCIFRHDIGLGESYMDGDFEASNLGGLMAIAAHNARQVNSNQSVLGWIGEKIMFLKHKLRSNTIQGSRRNIEEHYDSGNDMYKLFLDESMTYSCGIHKRGASLYDAQMAKLDSLIDKAGIKATDQVLEIGCGWGSFAIRAVQRTGCTVTGLTVSKAQLQEAQERVKVAGLDDRISLKFCDYRHCPGAGTYDKVVSCEMIEAVGKEHLESYFEVISKMLKPGGTSVLQAISVPDNRYDEYSHSSDFIREHIFPGGHLVCLDTILDHATRNDMAMTDFLDIGLDYAITLREWKRCWEDKEKQVLALGYSESFWRKYHMYFAYCEAGFDARYITNYQIVLTKGTAVKNDEVFEGRKDVDTPSQSSLRQSDYITQALQGIYFFLAGLAVSHRPYLLATPITTMIFPAILSLVSYASKSLGFYTELSNEDQLLWCNNAIRFIFSVIIGLLSSYHFQMPSWNLVVEKDTSLGVVLLCIAMGFAAYQAWNIVRNRLYKHHPIHLIYCTIVLCLFATAAYKQEHTGLLASMLVLEWSTAFHTLKSLMMQAGFPLKHWLLQSVIAVEHGTFVMLRLLPHLWVMVILIWRKLEFTSAVLYWMAFGGIVHCNVANLRRLMVAWKGQGNEKHKAS